MCYDTRCRKGAVGMTIKKRLFCSNILMIVVPAVIVAFVGLLCMALLWITHTETGIYHCIRYCRASSSCTDKNDA